MELMLTPILSVLAIIGVVISNVLLAILTTSVIGAISQRRTARKARG